MDFLRILCYSHHTKRPFYKNKKCKKKKGGIYMYILTILSIVVSTAIVLLFSPGGMGNFARFIDFYSILLLLIIVFPILLSSNLLKDFNNAFKIAFGKNSPQTLVKLRRSIEAVKLVEKTVLLASFFVFIATCIIILCGLDDLAQLGPYFSVAMLSCLYGVIVVILLLPIETKVKIKLIEFIQE